MIPHLMQVRSQRLFLSLSRSRLIQGERVHRIDGLAMGALPSLVSGASVPSGPVVDDTVAYPGDDADDADELDGEEEDAQDSRIFLPVVTR